MGGTEIL